MAIKWSAVKVSEAMDEIEAQLSYAQPFVNGALEKAREARNISHLPQYIDDRLARLIYDIEQKFGRLKQTIASVRNAIPEGAVDEERKINSYGSTSSLI